MSSTAFTFSNTRQKPIKKLISSLLYDKLPVNNISNDDYNKYTKEMNEMQIKTWEKNESVFLNKKEGYYWGNLFLFKLSKKDYLKKHTNDLWEKVEMELKESRMGAQNFRTILQRNGYFYKDLPKFYERNTLLLDRVYNSVSKGCGNDVFIINNIKNYFKSFERKYSNGENLSQEEDFFRDYFLISLKHCHIIYDPINLREYPGRRRDMMQAINLALINILRTKNILFIDDISIEKYFMSPIIQKNMGLFTRNPSEEEIIDDETENFDFFTYRPASLDVFDMSSYYLEESEYLSRESTNIPFEEI